MAAIVLSILAVIIAAGAFVVSFRKRADDVRPEIFITRCSLDHLTDGNLQVQIQEIKNSGKGFAAHVHGDARLILDGKGRFQATFEGRWIHQVDVNGT